MSAQPHVRGLACSAVAVAVAVARSWAAGGVGKLDASLVACVCRSRQESACWLGRHIVLVTRGAILVACVCRSRHKTTY